MALDPIKIIMVNCIDMFVNWKMLIQKRCPMTASGDKISLSRDENCKIHFQGTCQVQGRAAVQMYTWVNNPLGRWQFYWIKVALLLEVEIKMFLPAPHNFLIECWHFTKSTPVAVKSKTLFGSKESLITAKWIDTPNWESISELPSSTCRRGNCNSYHNFADYF